MAAVVKQVLVIVSAIGAIALIYYVAAWLRNRGNDVLSKRELGEWNRRALLDEVQSR